MTKDGKMLVNESDSNQISELFLCAAHVLGIEFYASKHENKAAELHCRIFSLEPLEKIELDRLARELNEAIYPVIQRHAESLQKQAMKLTEPGEVRQ